MTQFPLLSGQIALDLINTEVVAYSKLRDLLVTEDDLISWLEAIDSWHPFIAKELLPKVKTSPGLASELLERTRADRAVIKPLFLRLLKGEDSLSELISFCEKNLDAAPVAIKFMGDQLAYFPRKKISLSVSSLIAVNLLQLIANHELSYLKHCANESCVLLFLDKTGKRKWCSMQICGNRMKAEKFRSTLKSKG